LPPHIFFGLLAGLCLLPEPGDGSKAFFFAALFAQGQVPFPGKLHADTYVKQKAAAGLDAAAVCAAGQQLRGVDQKSGQQNQSNFYHKGNIHSGLYLCPKDGDHAEKRKRPSQILRQPFYFTVDL
jgi:hypothetical protein